MTFGRHLRELWRLKLALVATFLLSLLVATWSVARISLLPPSATPRKLETAAATTRLLVDTSKTMVLDTKVDTNDFKAVTNRAVLVGNIMATAPVRAYIARRAQVPAHLLQIASPVTPEWPRPLASNGQEKHTSDLLKSPDQYRLSIQVNPTVPVVDVYAQAPTQQAAEHLANGAVDGMRDYLRDLARAQAIPEQEQVHLEQLGRAKGGVINRGVSRKVFALSFVLFFGVANLAVLFLARMRQGWMIEARREQAPATDAVPT